MNSYGLLGPYSRAELDFIKRLRRREKEFTPFTMPVVKPLKSFEFKRNTMLRLKLC